MGLSAPQFLLSVSLFGPLSDLLADLDLLFDLLVGLPFGLLADLLYLLSGLFPQR